MREAVPKIGYLYRRDISREPGGLASYGYLGDIERPDGRSIEDK